MTVSYLGTSSSQLSEHEPQGYHRDGALSAAGSKNKTPQDFKKKTIFSHNSTSGQNEILCLQIRHEYQQLPRSLIPAVTPNQESGNIG